MLIIIINGIKGLLTKCSPPRCSVEGGVLDSREDACAGVSFSVDLQVLCRGLY